MENQLKVRRVKSLHSLVQVGAATGVTKAMEQVLNPVERVRSFHSHKTLATDVGRQTPESTGLQSCGCSMQRMWKEGAFQEGLSQGKCSTHSLEVPQASTSTAGAGASEPLYFDNDGQPVYTYMVSIPHVNKHLIKFPIALDHTTLRGSREWNNMENCTKSIACSSPLVLLKADTGADVNLMNKQTFNQLFGEAKVLQLTPIRMENYGNTAVKVLRMFHAFLRWKDKVYKQLFYITDRDRSPNLLSRDACYTLGVLKPCYTVENSTGSTDSTMCHSRTHSHASNKDDLAAKSFLHCKMSGSEKKLSNNSNKCSIFKEQL